MQVLVTLPPGLSQEELFARLDGLDCTLVPAPSHQPGQPGAEGSVIASILSHPDLARQLQAITDSAPVGIITTRATDGEIVFCNDAIAEQVEIDRERLLGQHTEAIYRHPTIRSKVREVMERDGCVRAMELPLTSRTGKERIMSVSAVPVAFEGETFFIATSIDVTDKRSQQRELEKSASQQRVLLREANHRVRNNLGSLLAFVEREQAKAQPDSGASLVRLSQRIRGLSAIHTLLSNSLWKPVPLRSAVRELVTATCQSRVPAHRIEVSGDCVALDSERAQQLAMALVELTMNAIEHAGRPDDLELQIHIEKRNDELQLTFSDNGVGFGDIANSPDSTQGMGLALVRALVEHSLQGQLELRDLEGARIELSFPFGIPDSPT